MISHAASSWGHLHASARLLMALLLSAGNTHHLQNDDDGQQTQKLINHFQNFLGFGKLHFHLRLELDDLQYSNNTVA